MKNLTSKFIIGTFVTLYLMVSIISTIHVVDFFELSNPYWLAVTLAIAFELGAAASLASLIAMEKMNKTLVWMLFITITLMQMQGNMYYAFKNITDYSTWSELFNLIDDDPIYQKRILAFVSGAILPLVALGFIKSLVDYIKPEKESEMPLEEKMESMRKVVDSYDDLNNELTKEQRGEILAEMMKNDQDLGLYDEWDETLMDGLEDEDFEDLIESIETSDDQPDLIDIIEQSNKKESGLVNPNPTRRKIKVDTNGFIQNNEAYTGFIQNPNDLK